MISGWRLVVQQTSHMSRELWLSASLPNCREKSEKLKVELISSGQ